jgi:hypothetical protein
MTLKEEGTHTLLMSTNDLDINTLMCFRGRSDNFLVVHGDFSQMVPRQNLYAYSAFEGN